MADNDWKARLGMVYSTDPGFKYETAEEPEAETLPPARQDLRVWLLGGKIYAACLRRSATDFRSNYCLGGSAAVYPLSPAERAQVSDIAALVQADYYAIDFVRHQGRWVFNELEDTVGARMLYDLTSLDPLADYCRYIQNCL